MKCKNCGADFPAKELRCPYCGTPNPKGRLWADRRERAEQKYEATRQQVERELPLSVAYRVAGRIRGILALILVVIFLGVCLWALVTAYGGKLRNKLQREKLETQMAELYEQERFGELRALMWDRELSGQDYYAYTQMCLIHYHYEEFTQRRMELFQGEKREERESDCVERILSEASEILALDMAAYPDLAPENEEVYNRYCLDITTFLRAMLGMTEEEVLSLSGQGYVPAKEGPDTVTPIEESDYNWGCGVYFSGDEPLITKILAEGAWK